MEAFSVGQLHRSENGSLCLGGQVVQRDAQSSPVDVDVVHGGDQIITGAWCGEGWYVLTAIFLCLNDVFTKNPFDTITAVKSVAKWGSGGSSRRRRNPFRPYRKSGIDRFLLPLQPPHLDCFPSFIYFRLFIYLFTYLFVYGVCVLLAAPIG